MNYKELYLKESNHCHTDWIPCEVCSSTAVDIHHVEARGMGGTKKKDSFENLMALCRKCHIEYGDITHLKEKLKQIHYRRFADILGHLIK